MPEQGRVKDYKSAECQSRGIKDIVLHLMQKSSIYAVSQLVATSGLSRKILWLIVLLIGLLGCSYQIYHFLSLYFQYPVVITLEVRNHWKLDFPAVTICNLNRLPYVHYQCLLRNLTMKECKIYKAENFYHDISAQREFSTCSRFHNGTFSEERIQSLTLMNKYLELAESTRMEYGYTAKDLITKCSFNGELCSHRNFTEFSSIQFGNCFVFNGRFKENEDPIQTPYIGPNSGLELSLKLNTDTYAPITSSVGARIVIHEADVEPNPEDDGMNITPGYETTFAIQQTSIYRLQEPYGDKCRNYKERNFSDKNQAMCIRKCIQNINFMACGCIDPFLTRQSLRPLCDLYNDSSVCCLNDVAESFDEKDISCGCPLPCKSTDYDITISTAEWPSITFFREFLKEDFQMKLKRKIENGIESHNTTILGNYNCCSNCTCHVEASLEEYREMFAKLKVFYKSLEKTSYKQEPMFQDSELFSQLGGQLGLWLGISLVALFECVENISNLTCYLFQKTRKAQRENSSV